MDHYDILSKKVRIFKDKKNSYYSGGVAYTIQEEAFTHMMDTHSRQEQ